MIGDLTRNDLKRPKPRLTQFQFSGPPNDSGRSFVCEVDGDAVARWYENLTTVRELSPGTAVRHFNVMHHMMKKAATIWSKDTGMIAIPPIRWRSNGQTAHEMWKLLEPISEREAVG